MGCFKKKDRTDSMEMGDLMGGTGRETRLPMEEEDSRSEKQEKRDKLKQKLAWRLLNWRGGRLDVLEVLLNNHDYYRLKELWREEIRNWDAATTKPSFLHYAGVHNLLYTLLRNTAVNYAYLKLIIERLECYNELIDYKNGPLHYAVEQKNEEMVGWLLESGRTDVHLRNIMKQSALTILCEEYDKCMPKPLAARAGDAGAGDADYFPPFGMGKRIDRLLERRSSFDVCRSTLLDGFCKPPPTATDGSTLPRIRRLIERLLKAGASFNVCHFNGFHLSRRLPFEMLLEHCPADEATREFVDQCVRLHKPGAIAIQINEADEWVVSFYNNDRNVRVTEELLEIYLRYNDERQFLKHMKDFAVSDANVKKVIELLLHTAIEDELSECVQRLVAVCGEVMFRVVQRSPGVQEQPQQSFELVHLVELKDLLLTACLSGDVFVVKLILSRMTNQVVLNDKPLLAYTLTTANKWWTGSKKHQALLACAEFLTTHPTIDISKANFHGNTPLHLAVKYGFEKVANMLLDQRHAFIGVFNEDNQTPLDYGSYEFWKEYFDRCMVVEMSSAQHELRFNLNCLKQPLPDKGKAGCKKPWAIGWRLWWWLFRQSLLSVLVKPWRAVVSAGIPPKRFRTVTEMTLVREIAQSKELKRLLIHPIIHTFIMVKWMRLGHWIYLNLVLTTATALLFGAYSLTACSAAGPSLALQVLAALGTMFMGGREVLQLLFLRQSYASLEQILDIVTVGGMCAVLWLGCSGLLASFVMISFAMQLTFLLGSLPFNSLSTIMYMFKTVSQNFLKSFLVFLPLILAFVFAFHLTYNEQDSDAGPDAAAATDGNGSTEDSFNNFRTFWNATIKTLVMTTGEFDAAAIDFSGGRFCLFIMFLFFGPIVILNLINGLAVSDIAAIRAESELISISKKVMLLERYERGVASVQPAWLRSLFPEPFFQRHTCRIDVLTERCESRKIVVHRLQAPAPAGGSGPVPSQRGRYEDEDCVSLSLPVFFFLRPDGFGYYVNLGLFGFTTFMRLDRAILNEALAIVEKRHPVSGAAVRSDMVPGGTQELEAVKESIREFKSMVADSEGAARSDMVPGGAQELGAVKESIRELKSMVAASQSQINELGATMRQVLDALARLEPPAK